MQEIAKKAVPGKYLVKLKKYERDKANINPQIVKKYVMKRNASDHIIYKYGDEREDHRVSGCQILVKKERFHVHEIFLYKLKGMPTL